MNAMTMTRKEELVSIYWDFYKEVHNFRPRHINFDACTELDLEVMLRQLEVVAKEVFAEQEQREQEAILKFEELVAAAMVTGAKDRETALRWIMEGSGCNGDWDYFAWQNGLPYAYFKKVALSAH